MKLIREALLLKKNNPFNGTEFTSVCSEKLNRIKEVNLLILGGINSVQFR